jgi:hypothetical protein
MSLRTISQSAWCCPVDPLVLSVHGLLLIAMYFVLQSKISSERPSGGPLTSAANAPTTRGTDGKIRSE